METDAKEDPYVGVRTEIARSLGPSAFPGDAAELVKVAKQNEASEDVMRLLDHLPRDTTFETTQEVIDALPLNRSQPDG